MEIHRQSPILIDGFVMVHKNNKKIARMPQKRGNMIENIIVGVIVALVIVAGVVAWWFENHGEDIQNPDEKKLQDKK